MPRNAQGTYSPPAGVIVTSGETILPQQHNPFITDAGQAISDSLSRDGRGGMRNDLDMGGFRVQNLAAGVNPNDAATVSQIQSASGVPVGSLFMWPSNTTPSGYLSCMGQSISRAQYPLLFTVLGTTYGSVNGSSFNLPDMRGRVVAGLDTEQNGSFADRITNFVSRVLGSFGGTQSVALTEGQMPEHDHPATITSAGAHVHPFYGSRAFDEPPVNQWRGDFGTGNNQSTTRNTGMQSAGDHTHTATIGKKGSGEAHPNLQPTIIMNYIIKAF